MFSLAANSDDYLEAFEGDIEVFYNSEIINSPTCVKKKKNSTGVAAASW